MAAEALAGAQGQWFTAGKVLVIGCDGRPELARLRVLHTNPFDLVYAKTGALLNLRYNAVHATRLKTFSFIYWGA